LRPGLTQAVLHGLAKAESVLPSLAGLEPIGVQLTRLSSHTFLATGIVDVRGGAVMPAQPGALTPLWRIRLDTLAVMQPVVVENHRTGERNVFVQDVDHTAYLLSKTGEILWERDLGGPIVGDVHQVDFYKNGKLQLLFATERAIQLIDVLGRDVSEFPLRLPATCTSGLMVADYEDQDLPRMFVACANDNVYGYKLTGEPLPGWNPKRRVGRVPYPLGHFMIGSKDYIQMTREDGAHLLLNRLGDNRRAPSAATPNLSGPFELVVEGDNFSFVSVTEEGRLIRLDAGGKVTTVDLDEVGFVVGFDVTDVNRDNTPDVLVSDTAAVHVFDLKGNRVGEFPIGGGARLFETADLVGAVGADTREAWLLASDHIDSRFPVSASAPFAAGELLSEGDQVIIVCTADGWVTAYRL
jgi:hypothetical protein